MSPALRKVSPRATSAAVPAPDRPWLAGDCSGGGEVVRDGASGAAGSSSGAGEVTGGGASAARAVSPGVGGRVAGRVVISSTGTSASSDGVDFVTESGVA